MYCWQIISLFLDLWICVDKLCKCIVDRLYSYFWIYESVLTTRQVVQMYCWQVIWLFLDLWICVDMLCKCIVGRLFIVDRLFLDLWICDMCILMKIIEALKQIMNLWQNVIYESTICVFLDLWTHNWLWFFFFFWWIYYNVYFWIFVVEQKQVMKNVKCKSRLWFFLVCKMLYGCVKRPKKVQNRFLKKTQKWTK